MQVERIREPKNIRFPDGTHQIANIGDIVVRNEENGTIQIFTTPAAFIAAYPGVGQAINWRKDIEDILDQAEIDITAITPAQVRQAFVSTLKLLRRNGYLDIK